MKKILIAAMAIAALAACNKAEVIESNPGEAIQFGNAFVDNATKATDPSYSNTNISKFNVYGTVNDVVIYDGTEITKGEAAYNSAWTCPVNQYWIPGASYKFVGIVDGNKKDVTETTLEKGMPTSISYQADGVTDLLCQTITKTANTDGTPNGLVAFNFTHLLSKVNFIVNNNSTAADKYSFNVKNIIFNGNVSGVYDVVNNTWKTKDFKTGNTALSNITVAAKAASSQLETEVLFLPGTYTVSFTVEILYDGNVITTTNYPANGTTYTHTLDANNAYNFNVGVSVGELIQFTVTQQPSWTPAADGTNVTLQ